MNVYHKYIIVFFLLLGACNSSVKKEGHSNDKEQISVSKIAMDNPAQYEITDSNLLTHIKGGFYKNKTGYLYEITIAQREFKGVDTLVDVVYYNGKIPQDIDPHTFQILDGWFAKDKSFAYYYRPTNGGMLISKLEGADVASFYVIKGDYRYAIDKRNVYNEAEIVKGLNSSKLEVQRNSKGAITLLKSGETSYKVDPVE